MPGFDRTGPMGYGPRTGRGLGPCGMGFRRGAGMGFGRGMGFRAYGPAYAGGYAPAYEPTREQEIAELRAEKELIERELDSIKERLKELETKK